MATAHASIVISDTNKIISGILMLGIQNELSHFQARDGEIHPSVQLVPEETVVRESFQVNDEHFREGPKVELLCRLLVFFTLRTVP